MTNPNRFQVCYIEPSGAMGAFPQTFPTQEDAEAWVVNWRAQTAYNSNDTNDKEYRYRLWIVESLWAEGRQTGTVSSSLTSRESTTFRIYWTSNSSNRSGVLEKVFMDYEEAEQWIQRIEDEDFTYRVVQEGDPVLDLSDLREGACGNCENCDCHQDEYPKDYFYPDVYPDGSYDWPAHSDDNQDMKDVLENLTAILKPQNGEPLTWAARRAMGLMDNLDEANREIARLTSLLNKMVEWESHITGLQNVLQPNPHEGLVSAAKRLQRTAQDAVAESTNRLAERNELERRVQELEGTPAHQKTELRLRKRIEELEMIFSEVEEERKHYQQQLKELTDILQPNFTETLKSEVLNLHKRTEEAEAKVTDQLTKRLEEREKNRVEVTSLRTAISLAWNVLQFRVKEIGGNEKFEQLLKRRESSYYQPDRVRDLEKAVEIVCDALTRRGEGGSYAEKDLAFAKREIDEAWKAAGSPVRTMGVSLASVIQTHRQELDDAKQTLREVRSILGAQKSERTPEAATRISTDRHLNRVSLKIARDEVDYWKNYALRSDK